MTTTSQAPTRAAILELMNEQSVVKEAYVFLDEKRLLLAAELLRQLHRYQQLSQELAELHTRARDACRQPSAITGSMVCKSIPPDPSRMLSRCKPHAISWV